MAIFKSVPTTKFINGKEVKTSECAIIETKNYTTNGEDALIVRGVDYCTITLNSSTTDHITIKAMTEVLISSSEEIDEEFVEIELQKGASIELRYMKGHWYIMSSDGLKNS